MDARIKAVTFDEENHKYFYNGKELHGITGAIGKIMGKNFPDTDVVKLATIYGSDVHKEIENYYNNGSKILSFEGAKWIVEYMEQFKKEHFVNKIECEVMVSDFEGTASKIDIVVRTDVGAYIFDIKTTSHFDRAYCSLQLSVYKKLYEQCYKDNIIGMFVLGTKSKRSFRILEQEHTKIDKILSINKGKQ
jgi:hypothetical protein